MAHTATKGKQNIFNEKQYKNHERKIEKIILNRKILSKVLKHQSDGSKYNFGKKHNIKKKVISTYSNIGEKRK